MTQEKKRRRRKRAPSPLPLFHKPRGMRTERTHLDDRREASRKACRRRVKPREKESGDGE